MVPLIGAVSVSRETEERLKHFAALVQKWSGTINLVSRDSLSDLWNRHILDSAQLFALDIGPHGPWLDIGSGGGFPGIVVAILLAERAPDRPLTLIESDQRKATFLRTALRECEVPGTVLAQRIEDVAPQGATTMTARALAPVSVLLDHAFTHLAQDGIALLHKGRTAQDELAAARATWSFDVTAHPSLTAPDAAVLEIRNIHRALA